MYLATSEESPGPAKTNGLSRFENAGDFFGLENRNMREAHEYKVSLCDAALENARNIDRTDALSLTEVLDRVRRIQSPNLRSQTSALPGEITSPFVEHEILSIRAPFARARNSYTPVQTLPLEILELIFQLSVSRQLDTGLDTSVERVLELCTVCGVWRDALCSMPYLWTTIRFGSECRGAAAALKYSQNLPIDIQGYVEIGAVLPTFQFAELVEPHSSRWRSFRWRGYNGFKYLQKILRSEPLPLLETLDLERCVSSTDTSGGRISYASRPNLRRVRLAGLPTLHQLDVSPNVRSLTMKEVIISNEDLNLIQIISQLVNLQDLTLTSIRYAYTVNHVPFSSQPILLPNLRSFHLEDVAVFDTFNFLGYLEADQLRSLTVTLSKQVELERLRVGLGQARRSILDGAGFIEITSKPSQLDIAVTPTDVVPDGPGRTVSFTISGKALINQFGTLTSEIHRELATIPIRLTLTQLWTCIHNPAFFDYVSSLTHLYIRTGNAEDQRGILERLSSPTVCPRLEEVVIVKTSGQAAAVKRAVEALWRFVKARVDVKVLDAEGVPYEKGSAVFADIATEEEKQGVL